MLDKINAEREKIDLTDKHIAELFAERMKSAGKIEKYKSASGRPIFDPGREKAMLEKELEYVAPELRKYYRRVLRCLIEASKAYQSEKLAAGNRLTVGTNCGSYDIIIEKGGIDSVGEIFDLDRKVLVVTDGGVPREYAQAVAEQCVGPTVITLPEGEKTKSLDCFSALEKAMLDGGFGRNDCVVAVGGGVVGDISGFAASCYMRGIDFYNVPTTLLSQADSSIGGKTAINFGGVKNPVGSFKQPKGVLIDTNLLSTLDRRQSRSGLAECIKAALIGDRKLYNIIENGNAEDNIDEIILRALKVKKNIVELDENEADLRRALNFGHTVGHAIEAESGLLHGECVALGMLPMVSGEIRERLSALYEKLGLPTKYEIGGDFARLLSHDKKAAAGSITAVTVNEIGKYSFTEMTAEKIETLAREALWR